MSCIWGRVFVEFTPQIRVEGEIQQVAGGSMRCMLAGLHLAARPPAAA